MVLVSREVASYPMQGAVERPSVPTLSPLPSPFHPSSRSLVVAHPFHDRITGIPPSGPKVDFSRRTTLVFQYWSKCMDISNSFALSTLDEWLESSITSLNWLKIYKIFYVHAVLININCHKRSFVFTIVRNFFYKSWKRHDTGKRAAAVLEMIVNDYCNALF